MALSQGEWPNGDDSNGIGNRYPGSCGDSFGCTARQLLLIGVQKITGGGRRLRRMGRHGDQLTGYTGANGQWVRRWEGLSRDEGPRGLCCCLSRFLEVLLRHSSIVFVRPIQLRTGNRKPFSMDAFTPAQTTELVSRIGAKKAKMRVDKMFVNSFLGGALLCFGAALALSTNTAPWFQTNAPGLIRTIGAMMFPGKLTLFSYVCIGENPLGQNSSCTAADCTKHQ